MARQGVLAVSVLKSSFTIRRPLSIIHYHTVHVSWPEVKSNFPPPPLPPACGVFTYVYFIIFYSITGGAVFSLTFAEEIVVYFINLGLK